MTGVFQDVYDLIGVVLQVDRFAVRHQVQIVLPGKDIAEAFTHFPLQKPQNPPYLLERKTFTPQLGNYCDFNYFLSRVYAFVTLMTRRHNFALIPPLQLAQADVGDARNIAAGEIFLGRGTFRTGLFCFEHGRRFPFDSYDLTDCSPSAIRVNRHSQTSERGSPGCIQTVNSHDNHIWRYPYRRSNCMRLFLVALAVSLCAAEASTGPGWTVQSSGSGLIFHWNRSQGDLRGADSVELQIVDGSIKRNFLLDQPSGTLFYTPQSTDVVYRIKFRTPAKLRRDLLVWEASAPSHQMVEVSVFEPSRRDEVKLRTRVREHRQPVAPAALGKRARRGPVDVEVFLKIDESGKAAAASSRYYENPVERRLAKIAVAAALQWTFDPVLLNGRPVYADAKLQFRF